MAFAAEFPACKQAFVLRTRLQYTDPSLVVEQRTPCIKERCGPWLHMYNMHIHSDGTDAIQYG